MRNSLLAVIFSLFYWSKGVSADDDIKRGTYQFMGFIYYQDESVVDGTGARFLQGAVLIRQNYLISSTLVSSISEDPLSKTLLARLGAIRIDANFTLNEDEDEQEQEIIQISRPQTINRTNWWATDISLLKTLLPFKTTSAVHVTKLSLRQDYTDKICNIIVFKKKSLNSDETRFLMPVAVEMLPSTAENCGEQFDDQTMACTVDPPGSSNEDRSPENYCQGNSGGPLICDNDVMALQTYINGNCNPPHLYQLLAPWKKFLECGTKDYCGNQEKCPNVCSVTLKDSPISPTTVTTTEATTTTEEPVITYEVTERTQSTVMTVKTTEEPAEAVESEAPNSEAANSEAANSEATESEATESETTATAEMSAANPESTTTSEVHVESSSMAVNPPQETPWPARRLIDEDEKVEKKKAREAKVQAQHRRVISHHRAAAYSSTDRTTIVLQSLIYNCLFAWICLM